LWPHDRRQLIDDLWALALAHLAELPRYEAQVNERARLTGRSLEPWRAILAVAAWLDDNGTVGLFDRLEALSVAYQEERADLEIGDLTALVIRALCRYVVTDVYDVSKETPDTAFSFGTSAVTKLAKDLAEEIEADIDPESITSRRVGRVLGKMRLKTDRTTKRRGWKMSLGDLLGWLTAYGIPAPDELADVQAIPAQANVIDDSNVITSYAAPEPERETIEI
jgi:hypothetical protein